MDAQDVAIWMHTNKPLENTKIPLMKIFSSGKNVYNVPMDQKQEIWVLCQNMYFGSIMHRAVSLSDFSRMSHFNIWFKFSAGPSAKEIAICECDRNLIVNLQSSTPSPSLANLPSSNCTKATVIHQTECCMLPNGLYDIFNPAVHCCDATGIHQIGDCWSIIRNHFVLFSRNHENFYRWFVCRTR